MIGMLTPQVLIISFGGRIILRVAVGPSGVILRGIIPYGAYSVPIFNANGVALGRLLVLWWAVLGIVQATTVEARNFLYISRLSMSNGRFAFRIRLGRHASKGIFRIPFTIRLSHGRSRLTSIRS